MKTFVFLLGLLVAPLLPSLAVAQGTTPLIVSAVQIGTVSDIAKPGDSEPRSYLFYLVSVSDEHGRGVAGLTKDSFTLYGTFISERPEAEQAREIFLMPLIVEAVLEPPSGSNCDGCYLVQASIRQPYTPLGSDHSANIIIRVTKTVRDLSLPGHVNMRIVAAGQATF
jgi:hypothetical protein